MHTGEFIFDGYSINSEKNTLDFTYIQVLDSGENHTFTETLTIPGSSLSKEKLNDGVLQGLHLVLGISYYKLYCSKKITLSGYSLSKSQADFWNKVYTKGLGEFFYTNGIDHRGLIEFPFEDGSTGLNTNLHSFDSDKALIPIGGGKDSIVSIETTKKAGISFDLFSLNSYPIIENVAKVVGQEVHIVHRKLDPKLIELNKSDGTFNGHVPISAIYAFVSVLYAMLFDYSHIVFSNEKSSNYGNTVHCGDEISHQWSKSREFEDMLREYVRENISDSITYFSLLRPLYEIQIAKLFSKYSDYFVHFSSSNHNFKMKSTSNQRWDYTSPKTAFVFAMLSAFLSKESMIEIFEKDIYNIRKLEGIYLELLGYKDIKPLECVGTPEEVKLAMYYAHERGDYRDEPIMKLYEEVALEDTKANLKDLEAKLFSYGNDSNIPGRFRDALKSLVHENN